MSEGHGVDLEKRRIAEININLYICCLLLQTSSKAKPTTGTLLERGSYCNAIYNLHCTQHLMRIAFQLKKPQELLQKESLKKGEDQIYGSVRSSGA